MIDIASQLKAFHREVGKRPIESGEGVGVLLRRSYDAPIEDVWDAVTDPDRMKRWFLRSAVTYVLAERSSSKATLGARSSDASRLVCSR